VTERVGAASRPATHKDSDSDQGYRGNAEGGDEREDDRSPELKQISSICTSVPIANSAAAKIATWACPMTPTTATAVPSLGMVRCQHEEVAEGAAYAGATSPNGMQRSGQVETGRRDRDQPSVTRFLSHGQLAQHGGVLTRADRHLDR